jgi:hypothetical protein
MAAALGHRPATFTEFIREHREEFTGVLTLALRPDRRWCGPERKSRPQTSISMRFLAPAPTARYAAPCFMIGNTQTICDRPQNRVESAPA